MPKSLGRALCGALAVVGVVRRAAGLSSAADDILSLAPIPGRRGLGITKRQLKAAQAVAQGIVAKSPLGAEPALEMRMGQFERFLRDYVVLPYDDWTNTSGRPDSLEQKASHLPSGENSAEHSSNLVSTTGRGLRSPPSESAKTSEPV